MIGFLSKIISPGKYRAGLLKEQLKADSLSTQIGLPHLTVTR